MDGPPQLPLDAPAFDPRGPADHVRAAERRRVRRRRQLLTLLAAGLVAGAVLVALRLDGFAAAEAARAAPTAAEVAGVAARDRELGGPSSRHGVLFVHGLGGSPADFDDWPERLAERTGWRVRVLELPGHGGGPDAFAAAGTSEWRAAVDEAWQSLAMACERVDVVGYSLGGALALEHAVEHPPRRLVLVAPYLRDRADGPLPGLVPLATRALAPFVPWVDGGTAPRGLSSEAVGAPPRQRAWPLATVIAAQRVAANARDARRLTRVASPVLILHARADRIAAPAASRRAAGHLARAEFVWLEAGDHLVPWDADGERAFDLLSAFLLADEAEAEVPSEGGER